MTTDPPRSPDGLVVRLRSFLSLAWTLHLAIALTSLAVTLSSRPGAYVDDFRFEVAWAPSQTLSRVWSIWQANGGLGGIAGTDRSLLPTLVFWLSEAFGAPPWVAQRIWHALLFFLAGTGAVAVVRLFEHRVGTWHTVAAGAYMFNPLSLGLLRPSPIFAVYAIAPWVVAAAVHGARRTDPWRWAATAALCVYFVAPIELPGTIYVLLFIPPVLGIAIVTDRRASIGAATGWTVRTALLTTLCMAPVLVRTYFAQGALERRLLVTESPQAVASTSSWSEAFRGMGTWLTYFDFGGEVNRPHLSSLLEEPVVIVATIAVPLLAVATLVVTSNRTARLSGGLAIISLMVVVGLHPTDNSSPWGRLLAWTFGQRPTTQAFRNTLKAGWLWALVVAVLFGLFAVGTARLLAQRSRVPARLTQVGAGALSLVLVALAGAPAFTGNLYSPDTVEEIPDYWTEAIGWLNASAADGQVLILPGTPAADYRWGDPGDDILEALLRRPFLTPNFFATSNGTSTNLLSELGERLHSEHLGDQSLGPILKRLGVRYVVVRNDLEWNDTGLPRPIALDPIRSDPAIRLAASFGTPGQNTTGVLPSRDDRFERSLSIFETGLAPIEIFELADAATVRALENGPPILLNGDGAGWIRAADAGLYTSEAPIAYVDAATDAELIVMLEAGAPVLLTDTNVERELRSVGDTALRSPPIFGGPSERFTDVLFPGSDTQSNLWTVDASSIRASSASLTEPHLRVTQAFDGDENTAWRVPVLEAAVGQAITVELREQQAIDQIELLSVGNLASISVSVDGRDPVELTFEDNAARVALGDEGTLIRFEITSVDTRLTEAPGLAEIRIDEQNLRILRTTSSSIVTRAAENPDLATALAAANMSIAFEREALSGRKLIETNIARRFSTDSQRTFAFRADLPAGVEVQNRGCVTRFRIDDLPYEAEIVDRAGPAGTTGLAMVGCSPIVLPAGQHVLGDITIRVDRVVLSDNTLFVSSAATELPVSVEVSALTHKEILIDNVQPGTTVLTGVGFHRGWTATVDGVEQTVRELNGQLAVVLDTSGPTLLTIDFGPQRGFAIASIISLAALCACLLLLLARQDAVAVLPSPAATLSPANTDTEKAVALTVTTQSRVVPVVAAAIAMVGFGWLAGGQPGLFVVLAALALGWRVNRRLPMIVGLAAVAIGGYLTLSEAELTQTLNFANARPGAAETTRLGLLALATAFVATSSVASSSPSKDAERATVREKLSQAIAAARARMAAATHGWYQALPTVARSMAAALIVGLGALVRFSPLSEEMPEVLQRLRDGDGYVAAFLEQSPTVTLSPFTAYAEAFGPVDARWTAAIIAAGGIAVLAKASRRLTIAAWVLAALIAPSAGAATAIGLLAAATAVGQLGTRRAAAATGVLAAAAALALPEAAVAAPFVIFMMFSRENRWTMRAVALSVAAAGITSWWVWLDGEVGLTLLRQAFSVLRLFLLVGPISVHWLTDPVDPSTRPKPASGHRHKRRDLYPEVLPGKLGKQPNDK